MTCSASLIDKDNILNEYQFTIKTASQLAVDQVRTHLAESITKADSDTVDQTQDRLCLKLLNNTSTSTKFIDFKCDLR